MNKVPGGRVLVAGHIILRCVVCGADRFERRDISMNTPGMTFLGWDWLNRTAVGAICVYCGYVHQFMRTVQWEFQPPR